MFIGKDLTKVFSTKNLLHTLLDSLKSLIIATHVDSLWQQRATTHDYDKNHTLSGNLAFNYNFSPSTSIGAQYDLMLQPTAKTHSRNLTEVFANQKYYDSWNTSEDVDSHQQKLIRSMPFRTALWTNGHSTSTVVSCQATANLKWLIRLDGLYMPVGKRQNMSTKSAGAVNMSIYKEWMNGKLSCLLEATNLFHTQKESFTLYLSKTKEYSSSSSNTRGISLTLRYSLNGKSNRYKGTGAGEEELRRL